METTTQDNPERQWIRLQEIGLCLALAIPNSIMVLAYIYGFYISDGVTASRIIIVIVLLTLLLGSASFTCIQYGADKRRELKDERLQEMWEQREPPS